MSQANGLMNLKSNNPVMNQSMLDSFQGSFFPTSQTMTVQGAATKSLILLGMCFGTGMLSFGWTMGANPAAAMPWILAGAIGGLIFGFVTSFKPDWAPITAPLYALAEGLALGGISGMYEHLFHGIVPQAALATIGTLGAMLFAYKTGLIRATSGFVMGVTAATSGIAFTYMIAIILGMFGIRMPFLFEASPIGIGISVVIVIVAAFNLILDFATIQMAAESGAPKYFEWYTAFGLMVTIVWLYIEMLRLLAIIAQYTKEK